MIDEKGFKKLIALCKMNTMSMDENGEFTVLPKSSTNQRRMLKDSSSSQTWGTLKNSKTWVPKKLYINENDLKEIWEKQNELCYWFKIPLESDLLFKKSPFYFPKHPLAPSIDRIDDEKDYTKDNVVVCCRLANFGRNVYPFDKYRQVIDIVTGGKKYEPI